MDLETTISINAQIMALIDSKYSDPFWYNTVTPEARYYLRLQDENLRGAHLLDQMQRARKEGPPCPA